MCGIAGAVGTHPDRLVGVRRLAQELVHRGPDDFGEFDDSNCSLAMRRLSVIDLAGGHQPLHNETGDVTAICNGELYNFQVLRPRLEALGHRFATRSDIEVAIHAYESWGEGFLSEINGMFALAIWDSRHRRLLLARDRLGKKPLYYAVTPHGLSFSSELRSLLSLPEARWTIDREACRAFCASGYMPDDRTPIAEIRRLQPGHLGVWSDANFKQRPYWTVQPAEIPPRLPDARRALFELFRDAVALRLIADVPIGVFLSGGLDSSTVVAMAAGELGARMPTFNVAFPDHPGFDEADYARRVAEHFGCEHHEIPVTFRQFEDIEDVIWRLDEPLADPAALPTLILSRVARQQVTVALTGEGADEVFGGYERYVLSLLGSKLSRWVPGMSALASAGLTLRGPSNTDDSRLSRTLRAMRDAGPDAVTWSRALAEAPGARALRTGTISERRRGTARSEEQLSAVQRDDISSLLANGLLTKVDRMTMAASLEARCPFLDYRVVQFGLGLPDRWKVRGLTSKRLLRELTRDMLPKTLRNRRKHTFRVPVGEWLRGPMKYLVEAVCDSPVLRGFDIIDLGVVREAAAAHLAGRADYSKALWALVTLHVWLEQAAQRTQLEAVA
jgi:asparagine synthase (glutamine-hydrolysing)